MIADTKGGNALRGYAEIDIDIAAVDLRWERSNPSTTYTSPIRKRHSPISKTTSPRHHTGSLHHGGAMPLLMACGIMTGLFAGIFIGLVVVSHTSNLHGQHDANPTMPQPYTDEQRVFRAHLVQLDELNETEESLSITSPSRSRSAVQPTLATARAARAIDATEQQSLREEWSGQCATTSSTLASSSSPSRRFELVLLSTYPRSGNSWTRALFRGSTLLDSRLTTVKGLDSLTQAAKYTLCSPQECSDNALGGYLLGMGSTWIETDNKKKRNKRKSNVQVGIQGGNKTSSNGDADSTKEKCDLQLPAEEGIAPWPYYPSLPPLLVKSHFPQIGNEAVESFTEGVTKIIHIVRNPFDNIASRYMGTQRTFEKRFNALVKARELGETTQEFDDFLIHEIENYKLFHAYWEGRRESDASRGIATLYTRYESLCEHTDHILREMLAFSGFKVMERSFACTLREFQCHVDKAGESADGKITFPSHRALFTREQTQKILAAHAGVMETYGYGYHLDSAAGVTITLKPPTIPMCNN